MNRSLSRLPSALFLRFLACLTLALCLPAPDGTAYPPSAEEIERLIEDLGSSRFEAREAATHALMEKEEAAAALHKALKSPDAEIRHRAARILKALEPKRAARALARARDLGKEGRVVEMVDRLVYWRKWDTKGEGWDSLTRFAEKMIDLTARDVVPPRFPHSANFRQNPKFPAGEFRRYAELAAPEQISGRKLLIDHAGRFLLRGEEVIVEGGVDPMVHTSIVAASEDARLIRTLDSVVIVGGDITIGRLQRSILICDGDVELLWPPETGLIIARGKVTCREGKLTGSGCIIRSENFYQFRNGKKIIIKDGTPDPVGFVKFFELSDVGLTIAERNQQGDSIEDGVGIEKVRKSSPFASGLRAGDIVTALEGKKVASQEMFRRLLRRKLAEGATAVTFTVRRAKETLDVSIPIKD